MNKKVCPVCLKEFTPAKQFGNKEHCDSACEHISKLEDPKEIEVIRKLYRK